jgi:uncharacterized protein (DUF885 family)
MTPDVNTQADRYIAAYFEAFPHQATLLGAADAQHDRLPDLSLEARTRWETTEDSILGALEAIDETGLEIGSPEAITYGFLTDFIRNARAWRMCRMELWNVSPTWTGWQQELALLASSQPIGTPEQNEAAYQRFSGLPHYLEQEVANLREGLSLGYTAPKGNVQSVIAQVDALLEAPVEESPFVAMAPDSLTEFRSRMEQLETTEIRPALLRYRDFLEIEYLPAARDAVSVGAVPDGAACYTAAIRYHATVDMSPEEVHETGLDQMQLIRAEMAGIAQSMIGSDDVDELLRRMRDDPQYQFSSRDEMLDAAESAVARAEAAIPQWFGIVPTADVRVQAVPSFSEPSAPGGFYNPPAEDGSRPGSKRPRSTRRGPAITCRARSRSNARACTRSSGTCICRASAKAGHCTPNGCRTRWACTPDPSTGSACCRTKHCARPGSWSMRACTRSAGPASRRSTTCSRTRRNRNRA